MLIAAQPPVTPPVTQAPVVFDTAAPPGTLASDSATGRPITLADAIRTAQRAAPGAIQARGQVRAADVTRRFAYAQFLPNVQVTGGLVRQINVTQRVNSQTGELVTGAYQTTTGLSATLTLFDGFQRVNTLRAARAQGVAAGANTQATNASLALSVKQQYFTAVAARETEAATRDQLAQAQAQLAIASAKLRAQTATKSDSLQAVIAVNTARLAALQAQTDRANADATLTRVIGADRPVSATADGLPDDTTLTADSVSLARLAAAGPVVRQAQATAQQARYTAKAARAAYFPSLSLGYSRNLSGASSTLDPFGTSYVPSGQLRLSLSLPVFDQFSTAVNVANSEVSLANSEANVRDQELAAQQTLVQAINGLRTARQQVAAETDAIAAAQENLRVQSQRYQLGVATSLDVLTAQSTLTQARLALVQARFSARTARAQLEALVGDATAAGTTP
ncbi:transporter [Gemmatimonadetes bacterium T265]|nr:transporter [Gemmatimonadetes bacterium T265]